MWRPPKNVPAFLPSRELQFSETGLGIRFIYGSARLNHYGWWRIKAIDDLGELFVLVPLFGSRIVFPKRDFPMAVAKRGVLRTARRSGTDDVSNGVPV